MNRTELLTQVAQLLRSRRWAALATRGGEEVLASMVAYAPEPDFGGLLLHLSRLAAHTRNLQNHPQASLVVSEPDPGTGDPQQLARLSLSGQAVVLPAGTDAFAEARRIYLDRLPSAEPLFEFPDFVLFRLTPREIRFVGGFARAHSLTAEDLGRAAALGQRGS